MITFNTTVFHYSYFLLILYYWHENPPFYVVTCCENMEYIIYIIHYLFLEGHPVEQLVEVLRKIRKVTGSITDEVIGIFHLNNPCSTTMIPGSGQVLTQICTRNIP